MNIILKTLKQLMDNKGYSENKLSVISSVPQSTINSLFKKNNMPSIATLQLLCEALDISMSRFFYLVESTQVSSGDALYTKEDQHYTISNIDHDLLLRLRSLDKKNQIIIDKLVTALYEK